MSPSSTPPNPTPPTRQDAPATPDAPDAQALLAGLPDGALVTRIQAGSLAAADTLWERHLPTVTRWLGHHCHDRPLGKDTLRDLLEDIHDRLLASLRHFKGLCSLTTWLYHLTHNAFVDSVRRRSTESRDPQGPRGLAQTLDTEGVLRLNPSYYWPPSIRGFRQDRAPALLQANLNGLSPAPRAVLELQAQNLPDADIARQLGISLGALRTRRARGLKALGKEPRRYVRRRPPRGRWLRRRSRCRRRSLQPA
jgi:RNA polymerase sigma factor (sigma-70 family)